MAGMGKNSGKCFSGKTSSGLSRDACIGLPGDACIYIDTNTQIIDTG